MLRFLATTIGSLLLAVALAFAVGDIARSLAEEAFRLRPLGEALASLGVSIEPGPDTTAVAAEALGLFAAWPAAVVLATAAFLFLALGRPKRAQRGRSVR